MINTICYNFQKKIIDDFNTQEDIPFILKFYLFKDIWEMIEQNKQLQDREVVKNLNSQEKTLTTEIPLDDLLNNQDQNNEQKEDD